MELRTVACAHERLEWIERMLLALVSVLDAAVVSREINQGVTLSGRDDVIDGHALLEFLAFRGATGGVAEVKTRRGSAQRKHVAVARFDIAGW